LSFCLRQSDLKRKRKWGRAREADKTPKKEVKKVHSCKKTEEIKNNGKRRSVK